MSSFASVELCQTVCLDLFWVLVHAVDIFVLIIVFAATFWAFFIAHAWETFKLLGD